jgi:hypothetical protein
LPEEAAEVMNLVREEVKRLHRILRELVTFARRRRDEASLVSPVAVVEDALRLLRHDPRMRGVRVERDFDPDTPPVFLVEDHLMQVVINLLMNSLDAMASEGTLRLEIRPSRDGVVVRVHDDGAGMSAAVLERCLEPLFTTKEEGKGTGLGLSIARDIIEAELDRPVDEIFRSFDPDPVAAASIAQVHFATTEDGRDVAVKILRPGIEERFERDIDLFYWLASWAERLAPAPSPEPEPETETKQAPVVQASEQPQEARP